MQQYSISNDSKERTVLLLHGYADDLHIFDDFADQLKEYRLIAINFPTTIIGNKKSYTIYELANYVKNIAEELNIKEFSIIGFSLGGLVAIELGKILPSYVKSLTLLCSYPVLPLAAYQRFLYRILRNILDWKFLKFCISRFLLSDTVRRVFNSPHINTETRMRIRENYISLYGTLFKCFDYDGRENYKNFVGKKQIIVSKDDSVLNYKFLRNQARKDGIEITVRSIDNHYIDFNNGDIDMLF